MNLNREELAAISALISHESTRDGSYLDPVWRDVLSGAATKITAELDANAPVQTEAQGQTVARLAGTFQIVQGPDLCDDGIVSLTYLASDGAGFTVRVPTLIYSDGEYTTSRFQREAR